MKFITIPVNFYNTNTNENYICNVCLEISNILYFRENPSGLTKIILKDSTDTILYTTLSFNEIVQLINDKLNENDIMRWIR